MDLGKEIRNIARAYQQHPMNVMEYILDIQKHKCWDDQVKKFFVPDYVKQYSLKVAKEYYKTNIGWNYEVKNNEFGNMETGRTKR